MRETQRSLALAALPTLVLVTLAGLGAAAPAGPSKLVYDVSVENSESLSFAKPTYAPSSFDPPTCLATTPEGSYSARFPRHDLCATVVADTGYELTDDISIQVTLTKGLITSVKLWGQDVIGEEGIMHESESIPIRPPLTPSKAGFTLHVHADNVPIWKLHNHLGGKRMAIVGYISLADMVYVPRP